MFCTRRLKVRKVFPGASHSGIALFAGRCHDA